MDNGALERRGGTLAPHDRHRRHRSLHTLLGVGAALALGVAVANSLAVDPRPEGALASALRAPTPPASAEMLRGTGVVRWGSLFRQARGYERFSYVLVSRADARAAARLPGTSLVYMSGTSVQQAWSTGVSYQEARSNDWLLRDGAGAYVMNARFGAFVGDLGNPAYQRRFINNVLEFLAENKTDGVFLDDVHGDPSVLTNGVYPAKYPTAEAWESATVSFVSNVGAALKARGHYVLANATKFVPNDPRSDSGANVAEFWGRLAPSVSGLMTEYWLQNPNDVSQLRVVGSTWHENWDGWQALVAVAQRHRADFFGLGYGSGTDRRAMRFLRGSFLLDWDGRGGALVYARTDGADPYHPSWVKQLGAPAGPKFRRRDGSWQRRFLRGIVVVNPTSAPVTARIGGAARTIAGADAVFVRAKRR